MKAIILKFSSYTAQALICHWLVIVLISFLAMQNAFSQAQENNFTVEGLNKMVQELENLPADKKELAKQLYSDWSNAGLNSVKKILISDSNYSTSMLVESLRAGKHPGTTGALLNAMNLNKETYDKIFLHIIETLRKEPEKLKRMADSAEVLKKHVKEQYKHGHLGLRAFGLGLVVFDCLAIAGSTYYGGEGAINFIKESNKMLSLVFGIALTTPFFTEVMKYKKTGREVLEIFKRRKQKKHFTKKIQKTLTWLQTDPATQRLIEDHTFLRNDNSEKIAFEALPNLQEAIINEVEFLLTLGPIGEKEAFSKLKLLNNFQDKLAKSLSTYEKTYILQEFENSDIDVLRPDYLQVKVGEQMHELMEHIEKAHGSRLNAEEYEVAANKLDHYEMEYSDLLHGKKSTLISTLGITIATALIAVNSLAHQLPDMNINLPIIGLVDITSILKDNPSVLNTAVATSVIGPAIYKLVDTYKAIKEGGRIDTAKQKLNRLRNNVDYFERKWLTEKLSCKSIL